MGGHDGKLIFYHGVKKIGCKPHTVGKSSQESVSSDCFRAEKPSLDSRQKPGFSLLSTFRSAPVSIW